MQTQNELFNNVVIFKETTTENGIFTFFLGFYEKETNYLATKNFKVYPQFLNLANKRELDAILHSIYRVEKMQCDQGLYNYIQSLKRYIIELSFNLIYNNM